MTNTTHRATFYAEIYDTQEDIDCRMLGVDPDDLRGVLEAVLKRDAEDAWHWAEGDEHYQIDVTVRKIGSEIEMTGSYWPVAGRFAVDSQAVPSISSGA